MAALAYWRLSLFYFIYFASVGSLLPYWSLYLQHIHFTALEIGQLMALLMGTKVIGPNVWGWIADRTQQPLAVLRLGCVMTFFIFLLIFKVTHFWSLAFAMIGFSFFWNAVLPQLEAVVLATLDKDKHLYSVIRLWGSIGFIVMVLGAGEIIDRWGAEWLPTVVAITMLLTAMSGLLLKKANNVELSDDPKEGSPESTSASTSASVNSSLWALMSKNRIEFVSVLTICFLMQLSHGPYYSFFSLYLEQSGYSAATIGWLWSIGVLAEIAFFMLLPKWKKEVLAYHLLLASLLIAAVRWVLTGLYPEHASLMIGLQLLHAATYGAFHIAIIMLIHSLFGQRHQSQGQALYSSIGYGLGGAVGAFVSGYLWKEVSPNSTYIMASVAALLGAMVTIHWRRKSGRLLKIEL